MRGFDQLFPLGEVVLTQAAHDLFNVENDQKGAQSLSYSLQFHMRGNWGIMPKLDHEENDRAVKDGGRIVSKYSFEGTNFYIITEADRSVTTVLLTSEY